MNRDEIKTNLDLLKINIEKSCAKVGRSPCEISLLPITKTKDKEIIKYAHTLGLSRLGESKVQEVIEKEEALSKLKIKWCFIGHLQSNKTKYVAKFASELHSLDSLPLAVELEKRLQAEGRSMDVLIQVNSSNEPQKYGLPPEQVPKFAKELESFSSLNIKGLMTLALFSNDKDKVRACFQRMSHLKKILQDKNRGHSNWNTLSMGMSSDYPIAIEEGATELRIGQGLFGKRERKTE